MRQRQFGMWAIICLAFLATACAPVQYVSQYDAVTDQGVTALQSKVNVHLTTLMAANESNCAFSNHENFYAEASADVDALIVRAEIVNDQIEGNLNRQTIGQLTGLKASITDLRDTHAGAGCLSADAAGIALDLLNTTFRAILILEIAKKRELTTVGGGS
ncbi:MAG: hypothetical protein QNI99_06065 [Woeseiaceae bacterium]|nr:hypothetical protein [Woeseiaceae bacterium]